MSDRAKLWFPYTEELLIIEFSLIPCARLLYHWLALRMSAETERIDFNEFRSLAAKHGTHAYTSRSVNRAIKQLEISELVKISRGNQIKVKVPNKVKSNAESRNSTKID